jgi:GcrA cell cycle regulator
MTGPRVNPGEGPRARGKGTFMQSMIWTPEQCDAFRKHVAAGLSFSEAAQALNAEFGTAHTRSAIIGRARRMKLPVRARPQRGPQLRRPKQERGHVSAAGSGQARPAPVPAAAPLRRSEPVKLRCVGIQPRLVPLEALGKGDCRYPYGGDKEGEAITFCGHPRFEGSSYCAPHFHLTRGPRIEPDRPTGPFVLRLVEAA